jgi:hypothetical protein
MQAVLDAIVSPRRREILRLIWDRELPAGEIAARFDVSWPAVSQNLSVLLKAGLVTERRGQPPFTGHAPRRWVAPEPPSRRCGPRPTACALWRKDERLEPIPPIELRVRVPGRRMRSPVLRRT